MNEIGNSIENTFHNNDVESFMKMFDTETFYSNIITVDSSNFKLRMFNKDFKQGINSKFADLLMLNIGEDEYYNFINFAYDDDENYYLRFRLYSDEGINYHEYFLAGSDSNIYKISDFYNYTTGEFISETLKRLYDFASSSIINREFTENDSLNLKAISTFIIAEEMKKKGYIEDAINLIQDIPDCEFKESKIYYIFKLLMIDIQDEEAYKQILEECMYKFPSNPTLYLFGIDYYLMNESYDKALEMVDNLEYITNDEFLDLYRCNIYFEAESYDKAEKFGENLLENFPYFFEAYENLLSIYAYNDKYEESTELLDKFLNNFDATKSEIVEMVKQFYPRFYRSKEFKHWKRK